MLQTVAIIVAAIMSAIYSGVSINKILSEKKAKQQTNQQEINRTITEKDELNNGTPSNNTEQVNNHENNDSLMIADREVGKVIWQKDFKPTRPENTFNQSSTKRRNGLYLGFGLSTMELSPKAISYEGKAHKSDLNQINTNSTGYNLYTGYKLFTGKSFFVAPELFGNLMFIGGFNMNYGGKINLGWNVADKFELGIFGGMMRGMLLSTYSSYYTAPVVGAFINMFTGKVVSLKINIGYIPETKMNFKTSSFSNDIIKTKSSAIIGGISLEFF